MRRRQRGRKNRPRPPGDAARPGEAPGGRAGLGSFGSGAVTAVGVVVAGFLGWLLWAAVTWLVGTKVLPEPGTSADLGQMLRTIGFSAAPGVLNLLGFVPLLGGLLWLVAAVWQLAAMVVAVRQALDYRSTGRAVLVCFIGWLFYVAVSIGVALMMGIGSVMMGG